MKTSVLIVVALVSFGSLAASRIMDDETLLRNPDLYAPYRPQDRMIHLTVKKSGVEFCIYQGEWQPMKGDTCELEQADLNRAKQVEEKMKQAAEKSRQFRAMNERFGKMTREDRFRLRQKKLRELLDPSPATVRFTRF